MKKNQLITLLLLIVLIIVTFIGIFTLDNSQIVYDGSIVEENKNKEINNNSEIIEVPNKNDLISNDYKEKFLINNGILHSIKDKIKIINVPNETNYYEENSTLFIKDGYVYNFEFFIEDFKFNAENHTFDLKINIYSLDLTASKEIKNSNFKLLYEGKELELINEENHTIDKTLTTLNLSYKINESLTRNDLNISFFNFKYLDKFNERNMTLY